MHLACQLKKELNERFLLSLKAPEGRLKYSELISHQQSKEEPETE